MYAHSRVPDDLQKDPLLYGECLSGALYTNDFTNYALRAGFANPVVVTSRPLGTCLGALLCRRRCLMMIYLDINNAELALKLGDISFSSVTLRLLKIDNADEGDEDFGDAVMYKGTIHDEEHGFQFAEDWYFPAHKSVLVSGNMARWLKASRFAKHFRFFMAEEGQRRHFGPFYHDE